VASEDNVERGSGACCSSPTVNLLFLSNLIPSKGVYVLLDACKILKEKGQDFHCHFVGGESKEINRSVFEQAVRERGLDDCVTYHGPKYGEDKERYWQMADIFVQPTFEDCFPLTLVEAMQNRLPIISTDEGAIPDIVKNGIYLSGGGALLRGLDRRLQAKINIPFHIADDPLHAVAKGAGIALKNVERFSFLMR
jgi:glycosyltransferase involved in cell wall biosynthesis